MVCGRASFIIALPLVPFAAAASFSVTKCREGKTDLVGAATDVFTVQVCNLFGASCYMNHVETASGDCATKALKVEPLQCALFPIMSYKDNDRADASKLQVGGGSKCSVSCSGTDCKFTGACVSVQCSLGSSTFAGPGMTKSGSGSARNVGVTNTDAADSFLVNDFASIAVSGSKTVLLTRTGDYVGTFARAGISTGTNEYNFGSLPTIDGNNYGPKACPSATSLRSASAATTKEELRMCGATGKWVYFGAANLLMDKSMYAQYSADSATGLASTKINIKSIPFLSGDSAYRSGDKMDDSRAVYLNEGSASSSSVLMTSETISPRKSSGMATQDIAGTWRFYTVVFYCDSFARKDLTVCPVGNQKMFYVGDPNPAPAFGSTAALMSAAGATGGTTGGATSGTTGGTTVQANDANGATRAVASLAALLTMAMVINN